MAQKRGLEASSQKAPHDHKNKDTACAMSLLFLSIYQVFRYNSPAIRTGQHLFFPKLLCRKSFAEVFFKIPGILVKCIRPRKRYAL